MDLLLKLSWVFMKIGTFSFGGGLVIIPMVENEVVWKYGWLTQKEFIDAITLGQVTPGPVIISATFIGYKVCGFWGALVSTISVILPSFIMICFATEGIRRFRESRYLSGFLHGARIAVIAVIFEAAFNIGKGAILDYWTAIVAVISLILLVKYKFDPILLFIIVAAVGLIL